MFEGTIKKLDLPNRTAVVSNPDGQEITVKFAERINVEVAENETAGWMGGELEDLEEGVIVELDLSPPRADGSYICDSVICIS